KRHVWGSRGRSGVRGVLGGTRMGPWIGCWGLETALMWPSAGIGRSLDHADLPHRVEERSLAKWRRCVWTAVSPSVGPVRASSDRDCYRRWGMGAPQSRRHGPRSRAGLCGWAVGPELGFLLGAAPLTRI